MNKLDRSNECKWQAIIIYLLEVSTPNSKELKVFSRHEPLAVESLSAYPLVVALP